MKELSNGEYFGTHYHKLVFNEFLITDTEYTHAKVDWHYHENPYFTYLLQGKLYEENKKQGYHLTSGSLLFHNWQDQHFNIKPPEHTRGFHVEISNNWFKKYDLKPFDFEGSLHLENPLLKEVMNKIFIETKTADTTTELSIEVLLLNLFENIHGNIKSNAKDTPTWVPKLKEILHFQPEICTSLSNLSTVLNIHPVHLSREFPKYFNTTISKYIRKQKVNKALLLIVANKHSMTEICYQCGFFDQSHFISAFKKVYGNTPLRLSKKVTQFY